MFALGWRASNGIVEVLMLRHRELIACFVLLLPVACHAACSDTTRGQSSSLYVEISDGACNYSAVMIQVKRMRDIDGRAADKPDQMEPFSKECRFTKNRGLVCRGDGATVLAGTVYELTSDTNPICPGEVIGTRLTCVRGCRKEVPKYLYTMPYEC